MTNVNEIVWKDVIGFEGFYQVSNTGLVRSIPRVGVKLGSTKHHYRELRQGRGRYNQVVLCRDSKAKSFVVHRLVARSFVNNPLGLPMVNHKDGNKHNNHVDNLEWTDHYGNTKHAVDNGLIPKGEKVYNSILSDAEVLHIKTNLSHLRPFQIAKMYNMNYSTMWDIIKRRKL